MLDLGFNVTEWSTKFVVVLINGNYCLRNDLFLSWCSVITEYSQLSEKIIVLFPFL